MPGLLEKYKNSYKLTSSNCWYWMLYKMPSGYGKIWIDGKSCYVHKEFYKAKFGPIPDGMVCHHICHIRACVNPYHIELLSVKDHVNHHHKIFSVQQEQEIAQLYEIMSLDKIASKHDVSRDTITRTLIKQGIKIRYTGIRMNETNTIRFTLVNDNDQTS